MKYHYKIFYCIVFTFTMSLLVGCSAGNKYKGMEIDGTAAACFNKEEVKFLVNSHFINKDKLSEVLFLGTEVSDKNCIGLYTYCFTARTMSTRIIHKVLKFEDKLYLVDDDNKTGDSLALKEFLDKYAILFSKDEIKRITDSFNAGTKFNGSFL